MLAALVAATVHAAPCTLEMEPLPEVGETTWGHEATGGADRAHAIRRIAAEPDALWAVVTDYDHYVDFMPYVTESEVRAHTVDDSGERFDVGIALTTKGITTRYEVRNTRAPGASRLDFEMVPGRMSPVRSLVGHWELCPGDGDTVVAYFLSARSAWWVPKPLRGTAAKLGVARVLETLEREVERRSTP